MKQIDCIIHLKNMFKIVENGYIKGWISQGCRYVFKALALRNLFCVNLKSLYFITINTRDILEVTQRTLLYNHAGQKAAELQVSKFVLSRNRTSVEHRFTVSNSFKIKLYDFFDVFFHAH